MKKTSRRRIPISEHVAKCTQDLRARFTDRAYGRLGSEVRGNIEVSFLRGYQAGYEDAIVGKPAEHYARSKREIRQEIRDDEKDRKCLMAKTEIEAGVVGEEADDASMD